MFSKHLFYLKVDCGKQSYWEGNAEEKRDHPVDVCHLAGGPGQDSFSISGFKIA